MVTLPSISAEYLPNSDIMPANGGSVINAGLHVFQNGKLPVRDLVNDSRPPTNMRLGGQWRYPGSFFSSVVRLNRVGGENHVLRQF
jgi:hypothetical protein